MITLTMVAVLATSFAEDVCKHYIEALNDYSAQSMSGDSYAQNMIEVHQMACQITMRDERGTMFTIKECYQDAYTQGFNCIVEY